MLLRAANNRLLRVLADDHPGFLCECGDRECARMIDVSLGDFRRLRSHPSRFLIAPGHQANEAERVIESGEGWAITEVDDLADERMRWSA
jgi:hypothetical protein